jgi:hypothetical protein
MKKLGSKRLKDNAAVERFGTIAVLLIALFSPCCFPIFAFVLSAIGLGSFELFGGWTMWIFQAMVLVAVLGFYLSFRKNNFPLPLIISILSAGMVFYGYHVDHTDHWIFWLYAGMSGLLLATGVNYWRNKKYPVCDTCGIYDGKKVVLNATLTCPNCGVKTTEIMPTDACQYFYECPQCKQILKPKQGDCCVYCSYANVQCPPIQAAGICC